MKTKSSTNIFVLALIMFSVAGCGKYEDGPWISFRSVGKRISHTVWNIKSVTENNNDITSEVQSHFDGISFVGNHDENSNIVGLKLYNGSSYVGFGSWYFSDNAYSEDDYSKLTMHLISFPGDTLACYPFPSNEFLIFVIQRLTMEDFWLQHTDSIGNEYYIKLKES
ncbi:hypothetical protein SDC9_48799 [bioreactor metagenome]|uniref:Lipoprotein n=1 Tax=bioreactor metagenome TaxID=1076179 RepID=A0A644WFF1_9ZZZZ